MFYALCYLSNYIAFDKSDNSLVVFFPGSAETNAE